MTHEPVDGYVLWANFTPAGSGRHHTLESLTEYMQHELSDVPLEKMLIQRNPIYGGWSVYLHKDFGYVCDDFAAYVKALRDLVDAVLRDIPRL